MAWNTSGFVWAGGAVTPASHTMSNDNKVSASLTAQNVQDIIGHFNAIRALLPFGVHFTPEERRSTPTIGTERTGMNSVFPGQMAAHPDLVPTYVDMPEVQKDSALWDQLAEIEVAANEVAEIISDTKRAVGSDLLLAYSSFYNNVTQAAKRGVAGIQTVYDNLRRFFRRSGGGGTDPAAAKPK